MSYIPVPVKTYDVVTTRTYTFNMFLINRIDTNDQGINVDVHLYFQEQQTEYTSSPRLVNIINVSIPSSVYQNFTPVDLTNYIANYVNNL